MTKPKKVDDAMKEYWLHGLLRSGGDLSALKDYELKAIIAGLKWLRDEIKGGTFTAEPTVEIDGLISRAEKEILKDEHFGTRVGYKLIHACIGPVFDSSYTIGVPDPKKALAFIKTIEMEAKRQRQGWASSG